MDNKKKLENAYSPDKETRKERVVVGLTGGIDSLVAAYLLKIQKYDLFAVTVVPGWDNFGGDRNQALSCHVNDERLESIKNFCTQLKIPLHVVKASGEFQDQVVEQWMSAKITGTSSIACWNCHALRLRMLHQKMLDLDAKFLATGHYAKLFHHAVHDTYYVHTSNDEEHDQSPLLNRLPSEILKVLLLPLSDLSKKEVLKLAENFGLTPRAAPLKMFQCFPTNASTVEYLAQRIPANYNKPGEMYSPDGTEMFGEHQGILNYDYGGAVKLALQTRKEDFYLCGYNMKERRVMLQLEDKFKQERVQLVDCEFSEEVSWVEPMKAVIRLPGDNYVDCWVHPKTLKTALVEWEGSQFVRSGEILPVMRRKGKNAKIYLTGMVRYVPSKKVSSEDDRGQEGKEPESDNSRDF